MIKKIAVTFVAILVSGCATVGSYQTECEQKNAAFADVVQCLKTSIASDSRTGMAKDARVRLYLLKADQLSQKVQNREIAEIDARVALQELYVQLKRDSDAETSMPETTRTNCTAYGNKVNCVTR